MNKLALVLALASTCVLEAAIGSTPAFALETYEAKIEARAEALARCLPLRPPLPPSLRPFP